MNVSERPADIKQRMDLFYAYMDENRARSRFEKIYYVANSICVGTSGNRKNNYTG